MRTRSSSNLIVESSTIPKRRNRRRSKKIVEPELQTIVETPVATMADTRTMSELLQVPTEGYRDAIVLPPILAENFELKVGLLTLVTSSQFHSSSGWQQMVIKLKYGRAGGSRSCRREIGRDGGGSRRQTAIGGVRRGGDVRRGSDVRW
ncbi:hypothetical protein Tco_1149313 [Tanacetum coccineum]